MRAVIVTGATSMSGVALIRELLKDVAIKKIYTVVQPGTRKWDRIPDDTRIERIDCGLDNYNMLPDLIHTSCDVFYHLAWIRTQTYKETSDDMIQKCKCIEGVIQAVEAAKKLDCSKVVWAGSQAEYGLIEGRIRPDTPCNPVRADGIAHLAAGKMGSALAEQYGIAFIWMRIFSIYGQYDRENSMISSTIRKLKAHEHCLFTQSEQLWDYLNAEDLGRALYLAGEKIKTSKIYCVGSGEEHPLREYIEIIRDIVSPDSKLGFGELPYPKNPIMRLCADNSTLIEDTGWRPKVSFHEGISRLAEKTN